jgi:hypothetical protein
MPVCSAGAMIPRVWERKRGRKDLRRPSFGLGLAAVCVSVVLAACGMADAPADRGVLTGTIQRCLGLQKIHSRVPVWVTVKRGPTTVSRMPVKEGQKFSVYLRRPGDYTVLFAATYGPNHNSHDTIKENTVTVKLGHIYTVGPCNAK